MTQPIDGRYEVIRPLSFGGFGITYLALGYTPPVADCSWSGLWCMASRMALYVMGRAEEDSEGWCPRQPQRLGIPDKIR
jgi:hypothetical protein